MSAASRAEARKKAILSRGTDRLAKLTTSARGEDSPVYHHDDPPLANLPTTNARSFLGEESTDMPTPARASSSNSPSPSPQPPRKERTPSWNANPLDGLAGSGPDPSVWNAEQQQQFLQALMNASGGPLPFGQLPGMQDSDAPPIDNPFAALMRQQAGNGAEFESSMFPTAVEPPKEKTRMQKALPLLHLIAVWCLLAYFVLFIEPAAYQEGVGEDLGLTAASLWRRWSDLGQRNPLSNATQTFRIQIVPFFWAFTTLQIALHSLRIFSGFDAVQPPALLALAIPHLPSPFPSIIMNSLKYMQMGSLFLDDLSGLVVGIGFIIYFSGWLTQSSTYSFA